MGNDRPRVLIIGGGFGGLFCARRLGGVDVDVTLLDRAACHVFQPLLYQCATGTLSIGQISRSLREELAPHPNVTTLLGEAIKLDPEARRVTARRPDESMYELDYDYLVIAAGMRQSYFGKEEFAAWAPGYEDARRCVEHPSTSLRGVRDRRDLAARPGARRVAHVRSGGRGPHRRGIGRADTGTRNPRAGQ